MGSLNIVDVHLTLVSELERALAVFLAERIGFVELCVLR